MKFNLNKNVAFGWVEPGGVKKLRDSIRYGKDPFWEKITYKTIFGYLIWFLLFFFSYIGNRLDENTSEIRLILSATIFSIVVVAAYSILGYLYGLSFDSRVALKRKSVFLSRSGQAREIKWKKISRIEFISGYYSNKEFYILNLKQKTKNLDTLFISDIINRDYIIEFLQKIKIPVTEYKLESYLTKKGVNVNQDGQIVNTASAYFHYPRKSSITGTALAIIGLIGLLICLYFTIFSPPVEHSEIIALYIGDLMILGMLLGGILIYKDGSQKVIIDSPNIVQNFKFGKPKKFNITKPLSVKIDLGGALVLDNKEKKLSIDIKLINLIDFIKEVDRISNAKILETLHKQQYDRFIKVMEKPAG